MLRIHLYATSQASRSAKKKFPEKITYLDTAINNKYNITIKIISSLKRLNIQFSNSIRSKIQHLGA